MEEKGVELGSKINISTQCSAKTNAANGSIKKMETTDTLVYVPPPFLHTNVQATV